MGGKGTILFIYLKNRDEALELEEGRGSRKSAPPGDESLQVDVTAGSLQTPFPFLKQSHSKHKRLQNSECASRLSVVIDI